MYKYTANFFQQFQQTIPAAGLPEGAEGYVWGSYATSEELPTEDVSDGDYAYVASERYTQTFIRTSGAWKCVLAVTEDWDFRNMPTAEETLDGCVLALKKGTRVFSTDLGHFVPQFVIDYGTPARETPLLVGDEADVTAIQTKGFTTSVSGTGTITQDNGYIKLALGATAGSTALFNKTYTGVTFNENIYMRCQFKLGISGSLGGTWIARPFYSGISGTAGSVHVGLASATTNNRLTRVSGSSLADVVQYGTYQSSQILSSDTDEHTLEVWAAPGSGRETVIWIDGNDTPFSVSGTSVITAAVTDAVLGAYLYRGTGPTMNMWVKNWQAFTFA